MKILLILISILTISCSQKYQTFEVIKKKDFVFGEAHNPSIPKKRLGRKVIQNTCEGQILFLRNAKKITDASVPALINFSCPGEEYLLNAKITQTWWTTIIYSRSCIKIESFCPR
jgi:hypothetical protein